MYVAIMGHGVVGSGVAEVFAKNHDSILKRCGQKDMELKYILDLRTFPDDPNADKFTTNFDDIFLDDEVKIVVETMGGLHPAFEYVSACLKAGKSVVTSNKELVAAKGVELLRLSEEHNVNFLFEASVGGGIPIIRPISQCLAANELTEIAGILNGTTNFILTRMIEDHMEFADALRLAQDNGYAEKDPTADIEGIDACRKICILASLCFGHHIYPDDVFTKGIPSISSEDVAYAQAFGGVIKLLGTAKKLADGRVTATVRPCIIDRHSQLANVTDVFNAILVRGDVIGDVVFYGRGAGKLPTASAVVADVIDCAKHLKRKKIFGWADSDPGYVADHLDQPVRMYVRLLAADRGMALAQADAVFGGVRALTRAGAPEEELAFVTAGEIGTERDFLAWLDTLEDVTVCNTIRVTDY